MAIFFSTDYENEAALKQSVRALNLRKLARNVWTDEQGDDGDIINRHCHEIVAKLLPGAVINRRSGFSWKPENGKLYVSHPRKRPLELPGLTIIPDESKNGRQPDDIQLNSEGTLFGASQVRALIENVSKRGAPATWSSRLSREELHDQIARIVTSNTKQLNQNLVELVMQRPESSERETVIRFLEAAIHERPSVPTDSPAYKAATTGNPYDAHRVDLFATVVAELENIQPIQRFVENVDNTKYTPFYEAYFSNFIEGTEFDIDEAEAIIFRDEDLGRPKDAHDVSATYAIVSSNTEMSRTFDNAKDFMDNLRERHATMMNLRPEVLPGHWKQKANRAGATVFVDPAMVQGTLQAGWEIGQTLTDPFARAVYGMFFVSEVHPFTDGNGRAARITMNNELHAAGMQHVIIPNILRIEYNSALVRATAGNGIQGLTRVLNHAQKWVSVAPFDTLENGYQYLVATNALIDSTQAERTGKALAILTTNQIEYLYKLKQEPPFTPDAHMTSQAHLPGNPPQTHNGLGF